MKVIKVLGAIIGVILLVVVVLYFMGPSKVHMERSISINASSSEIYSELNGFETYNEWSSWHDKDPAAEYKIEGPATGPGAKFSWVSDSSDVGAGWMKIEEVEESKMILYLMNFGFPGKQYARFILEEKEPGTTKVTWTYEEEPESFVKAMYVFMDMDAMLGPDYEKGLEQLKVYIESKSSSNPNISIVEAVPVTYMGLKVKVAPATSENISSKMGESYGQIMGYMQSSEIEMTGMPLAVYTTMSEEEIEMICGIPVAEGATSGHEDIEVMTIEGGQAVKAIHMGDYVNLPATYELVNTYMADNELEIAGNPYEIYVTDPGQVPDTAQWVTHVFYPVK